MKIVKFEDLAIWKLSLKITKNIYDITAKKEFIKDFALVNQLRRAIVAVSSNIVEGFEKNNNNEFGRYLRIAKGSVGEVRNQLYICREVGYITDSEFQQVSSELIQLANQLGGFIHYLTKKKANKEFESKK